MNRRGALPIITLALTIVVLGPVVATLIYNITNSYNAKSVIRNLYAVGVSSRQSLLDCADCFSQSASKNAVPALDQWIELGRKLDHNDPRWNYVVGYTKLAQGDLEAARATFEDYLASDHDKSAVSYFLVGLTCELSGKRNQAIQVWSQDPHIAQYFLGMAAEELYHHDNPAAALEYFLIASEIEPTQCEPWYRLGVTWMKLGDSTQAMQALSDIERLDCSDLLLGEAYYLRGKLLVDFGRQEEAIVDLRRALRLNPRDPKRLIVLGDSLVKGGGDVDEAHALFTRAIALAPDNIWPYIHLCLLEHRQQNFADALHWCRKATERFPLDSVGFHYTGLIYFETGNIAEAITWLERAIALDDKNVNTWNRLGDAYWAADQAERAAEAYQTVLKMDPENSYARRRINELLGK